jgi:hypothetical protein
VDHRAKDGAAMGLDAAVALKHNPTVTQGEGAPVLGELGGGHIGVENDFHAPGLTVFRFSPKGALDEPVLIL